MKKKKQDDEEDPGFKMGPSNFLTDLMVANTEYDEEWKEKNESDNPSQKYYLDMIKTQKTAEIEAEIRKVSNIRYYLLLSCNVLLGKC